MTFILNILHRDMSILAADQKAISRQSADAVLGSAPIVSDYMKIALSSNHHLAIAISGNTDEHFYLPEIPSCGSINDALFKVRKTMEGKLRVNDRAGLMSLPSYAVNQSIATFFDQDLGVYFSNEFIFGPAHNQTRLHRANDEIKIFHAGTGSEYYEKTVSTKSIEEFKALAGISGNPEVCIPWIMDVYKKVGGNDRFSGSEPVIFVSTRTTPRFRQMNLNPES